MNDVKETNKTADKDAEWKKYQGILSIMCSTSETFKYLMNFMEKTNIVPLGHHILLGVTWMKVLLSMSEDVIRVKRENKIQKWTQQASW